jgi:hypothetical protein
LIDDRCKTKTGIELDASGLAVELSGHLVVHGVLVREALCLRSGRLHGDVAQLVPDHLMQSVV